MSRQILAPCVKWGLTKAMYIFLISHGGVTGCRARIMFPVFFAFPALIRMLTFILFYFYLFCHGSYKIMEISRVCH